VNCRGNVLSNVKKTLWVLRRIFGPKRDKVTGGWRKLNNDRCRQIKKDGMGREYSTHMIGKCICIVFRFSSVARLSVFSLFCVSHQRTSAATDMSAVDAECCHVNTRSVALQTVYWHVWISLTCRIEGGELNCIE
jgi:hypothetical protein